MKIGRENDPSDINRDIERDDDLMSGGLVSGNLMSLQHKIKSAAADTQTLSRQLFVPTAFFQDFQEGFSFPLG